MTKPAAAEPVFFATPAEWRAWLEAHHASERELLVGFHKVGSGRPSITWPESVDQALCFGWIDGVRRSLGPDAYTIRFTPRKPRSTWSAVNIRRFGELREMGLVHPAGMAAWERRTEDNSGIYSYEQRHQAVLDAELEARFRADAAAWAFFQAQPPGYRATATFFVMGAKQPATRLRRLERLIADSAAGRRITELDPRPRKQ
ncbi:MAG TPA: YdeI/OmpD-associated family protein [Longimicrobium sp.]|nr:YdeI/OmpD-associated family protein [Longimicrobium sp.]